MRFICMHILFFVLASLVLETKALKYPYRSAKGDDDDATTLNALLQFYTNSTQNLIVSTRNTLCYDCKKVERIEISYFENSSIQMDTFFPSYYIYIRKRLTGESICAQYLKEPFTFDENGTYLLSIFYTNATYQCSMQQINAGINVYKPLIVAASILIGSGLIYATCKFVYKRIFVASRNPNLSIVNSELGIASSTYLLETDNNASTAVSKRMKSVDVLRGLCLAIMIFANYGSGGYGFLDHSPWNGIHLADTVFPCFIFIMGISLPLSFKSIANKQVTSSATINLKSIIYKIIKRSLLLFFFGLLTSNSADIYLNNLRLMGVLQRFSISYFVCAFIELYYFKANNYSYSASELILPTNKIKFNFMEILLYPIQWLIVAFLVLVWLLVTFLLPVDGCPTGYLGPGGLNANGQYFNCTGGAAGFIDRIVLGANHIYADPTCKEIYQTTIPYDPEGLLGCLTSCVLCYIGVSIGHVIVHYKEVSKRIWKFLAYAIFYGSISLILTKCSLNDGWIPINKNLWSLSFIFSIASIALIALVILYFLIDIYDVYSGTPFLYLGRNSITIYICHILFREYFPFFKVDNEHSYLLGLHLYGVAIWCLVAAIMNKKKVYINL